MAELEVDDPEVRLGQPAVRGLPAVGGGVVVEWESSLGRLDVPGLCTLPADWGTVHGWSLLRAIESACMAHKHCAPPVLVSQLALALQMSLAEAQQPPKEEEKKE